MDELAVGQIWLEVDPRFARHIRIESVGYGPRSIGVRTVVPDGGRWVEAPRSRASYCARERFNGKRGGYELVLPAEQKD